MKLTKDYIINHMRATLYPCWSLFVMQNYKRVPIMHYNGDDFVPDDTQESKTEKGIARLNGALNAGIPDDALLSIELRSSKGANGSQGTLGPFEFVNRDKDDGEPQAATTPATPASFGGLGFATPPAGWVSEEMLAGKLEILAEKNEQKINEILLKQKEKELKEWANRERAEIAELKKELKDEKKKYENNTGAAAETLVFAIKKLIVELFPGSGIAGALAGSPATTTEEPPLMNDAAAENSPKYRAVEGLASMLYEDSRVTEADVEKIRGIIEKQLDINAQHTGGEEAAQNV